MKLPRFLASGDVLGSPRQLVHSLVLLLHGMKRILLDPVVYDGWDVAGFSNFWLVRPALVVCCLFLYRVYFSTSVWRAFSARQLGVICTCCFAYFLDGSTGCSVLWDLCAEYSLFLIHQAPLVV